MEVFTEAFVNVAKCPAAVCFVRHFFWTCNFESPLAIRKQTWKSSVEMARIVSTSARKGAVRVSLCILIYMCSSSPYVNTAPFSDCETFARAWAKISLLLMSVATTSTTPRDCNGTALASISWHKKLKGSKWANATYHCPLHWCSWGLHQLQCFQHQECLKFQKKVLNSIVRWIKPQQAFNTHRCLHLPACLVHILLFLLPEGKYCQKILSLRISPQVHHVWEVRWDMWDKCICSCKEGCFLLTTPEPFIHDFRWCVRIQEAFSVVSF